MTPYKIGMAVISLFTFICLALFLGCLWQKCFFGAIASIVATYFCAAMAAYLYDDKKFYEELYGKNKKRKKQNKSKKK